MNHDEHKVEYIKLGDDMYQVKLSSIYDTNCADQEYLIVNGELLAFILDSEKKVAAMHRTDRNHCISVNYNDEIGGALNLEELAVVEENYSFLSEEDPALHEQELIKLKAIINELTDLQRNRLYVHIVYQKTMEEIAACEGVTDEAVRKSCDAAKKRLRKHGDFLQKMSIKEWLYLLKTPNFKKYAKFFS